MTDASWALTEHVVASVEKRTHALESLIRRALLAGIDADRLWVRVVEEPSDDVYERSDLMCIIDGCQSIVLGSYEIGRVS